VVALKVAALAAMPLALAGAALVAGHAASRLSCVVIVATSRYLRPDGTAAFAAGGPGGRGLVVAGVTAGLGIAALLPAGGAGAVAAGAAGLAVGHLLARGLFERRLGGYTGDCLGATQQLGEVGLYLGVLAWA
jgi:adenosylcobinamide-GDP ribazoletransferase